MNSLIIVIAPYNPYANYTYMKTTINTLSFNAYFMKIGWAILKICACELKKHLHFAVDFEQPLNLLRKLVFANTQTIVNQNIYESLFVI